ncbi:hypothetical protein ACTJKQ_12635 [Acidovorax sp. 22279]|uniref:hypothetical protein n=1 Tax=Acidovorax sp. 22279 TaxID=3453900 RepID=UPI003F8405D2
MSATPRKSYPQPEEVGETGKLLVVVNTKNNNNNNNAARSAAPVLSFANGSGLTQAEQEHLSKLLQYHPHGQAIADELAGQLRARGRGGAGIRSPRALAVRLAREATIRGVGLWYYCLDEADRRALQPGGTHDEAPAPASRETIERARAEAQAIRERMAAERLTRGGK